MENETLKALDKLRIDKKNIKTQDLKKALRLIKKYKITQQQIIEKLYLIEYVIETEIKSR